MSRTTHEWCAGLPLVETRPFTPEEQQTLQQEAERLRQRVRALRLVSLLLLALAVLFMAACIKMARVNMNFSLAALFFALFLIPISLLFLHLIARDARKQSQGLFRDLESDGIKRFMGRLTASMEQDETVQQLRRARLLSRTEAEWSLEILPASHRVWRINEQPVAKWIEIPSVELAETPPFASIASQWLEPAPQNEAGIVAFGQREMSEDERQELRHYARRLWQRPLAISVGLSLWIVPRFIYLWSQGARRDGDGVWHSISGLLLAGFYLALAFAVYQSRKLQQDAQHGRLHILRRAANAETQTTSADVTRQEPEILELLSLSRKLWSEDGRPAVWRMKSLE